MIELYYAATPNGLKPKLFLEEAGLPYFVTPVMLSEGEQFRPGFRAISPNSKIPAIVDHAPAGGGSPIAVFESGAILLYLAEKIGRFIPRHTADRVQVLEWLFWQVSGLGPMAGQVGHFNVYAPEKVPYAIDRYTREVARLYGVLDRRLDGREFIAGELSIADMAVYPWVVPHEVHGQNLERFPHLERWFDAMSRRPATLRAYEGVENVYVPPAALTSRARRVLFGQGPEPGVEGLLTGSDTAGT